MSKMSSVDISCINIKPHNSMGIVERYHAPLWNTFRKLQLVNPNDELSFVLAISIYAMNNTLGSEGIVLSVLLFG